MKKRLSSFLSLIFVFIVAFVFAGCAGPENLDELDEMLENGELSEEDYYDQLEQAAASIPLDGVLVLRKPSEYDFVNNVIESDYYASFAEDVLYTLYQTYGSLNYDLSEVDSNIFRMMNEELVNKGYEENEDLTDLSNQFETNPDNFIGFFDAIRYQITNTSAELTFAYGTDGMITVDGVQYMYTYSDESGLRLESLDGATYTSTTNLISVNGVEYVFIVSNGDLTMTSSFPTSTRVDASDQYAWNWSLPYDQEGYEAWVHAYDDDAEDEEISAKYNNNDPNLRYDYESFSNYYIGDFYRFDYPFDSAAYLSSFANSEYATALEYAIYRMAIGLRPAEISVTYDSVTGQPTVTVEGFAPQGGAEPKTSVQVALESAKEDFYELGTYVGLTSTTKENIVNFILDEIIGERAQSTQLAQDTLQYEVITRAIVEYTGTLTTVGQTMPDEEDPEAPTDDNPTYVGDTFTASEAVLFPYTTFFSAASNDNPFVNVGGPYEYQSFVILPKNNDYEIGDIWLDMKYDAGNDGDEIVTDETLDMTIYVRWVQVQTDAEGNVLSRNVRQLSQHVSIPDGPYRAGYDGWFVEFELDVPSGFGETVKLGEFPVPEELTPDKSENASNRVVTITGLTDARKYYEVLESSYNSASTYAVLDSEQFNCSYFEVAFDVEKEPGNLTKNYAFYCSILNLFEPPSWPNDPVWH